jgi:glycosyltransferase involved in cell wall biosynthesis
VIAAVASYRPRTGVAPVGGGGPAIVEHLRLLRRHRPDLLHVNLRTPYACTAALTAGASTRRARVVAVEHLPLPTSSRRNKAVKRLLARTLDAHVAVSDATARSVEADAGLSPGSIRTIHNGVEDAAIAAGPLPAPPPYVAAAGRLERQKGFDVLLEALVRVPQVRAVVVGDGPERDALAADAARLGVSARVTFTGARADARSVLAHAEAVVLPSRYEGLPLVLLEAMLAGRPIVASDVGGIRECLVPEETGLLVPADDADALAAALRSLLDDADRATRLGREAARRARERWTATAMAAAYERVYVEVLQR